MCLEYHKGYPCVYKAIRCQEGYCSNCVIYLSKSQDWEWLNTNIRIHNPRKPKRYESLAHSEELATIT